MQTLVNNSDFKKKLYYDDDSGTSCNMRMIDWGRGRPYTFRMEDKEEILALDRLFVRKVDEKTDAGLVKFLHERLMQS